jgi:hypothetical protein
MLHLILPQHTKPQRPQELQNDVQAWLLKTQRHIGMQRYDVKYHIATIEIQVMPSIIYNKSLEHLCFVKVLCED